MEENWSINNINLKGNFKITTTYDILDEWVYFLKNVSAYSTHTCDAYKRDLIDFFEFCKIREFNAFQPNKYILRDYLFELNEKEVSILRKSGEYLIEEVRQGDEAHIRCYYFNTTL